MPFIIVRNDITQMQVDAIVNPANPTLLGGGGVDGAIHRAAGPELQAECLTLGGCPTGGARLTRGYRLPARYVIHTVGPIWRDGQHGEQEKLASCYRESLKLARETGCQSVAFPLISAGAYGYPTREAMKVARDEIVSFLEEADMTVYLVIFDGDAMIEGRALFPDIGEYIDEAYARERHESEQERARRAMMQRMADYEEDEPPRAASKKSILGGALGGLIRRPGGAPPVRRQQPTKEAPKERFRAPSGAPPARRSRPMEDALEDRSQAPLREYSTVPHDLAQQLEQLDEGFSAMLLRLIDQAGLTDAQCYHKANIDRKLFSKIRSNPAYRPSKNTVLAFAIALRLPMDATRALLRSAGFALTRANKADVIVEYFIRKGDYDIYEINEVLFAFDQSLLGGA